MILQFCSPIDALQERRRGLLECFALSDDVCCYLYILVLSAIYHFARSAMIFTTRHSCIRK